MNTIVIDEEMEAQGGYIIWPRLLLVFLVLGLFVFPFYIGNKIFMNKSPCELIFEEFQKGNIVFCKVKIPKT